MNFLQPYWLLALLPLLWVCVALVARPLSRREKWRLPLLLLAMAAVVLALSKPYWNFRPEPQIVRGTDYVVMIDVSQSMFSSEGTTRRIDRATRTLRNILPRLSGSSAGVVYFAGEAQIGCPLTPDLQALSLFLDSIAPGMTAHPGTKSAPMIEALTEMLGPQQETSRKKLGLLFSDGEFSDGAGSLTRWLKTRTDFTLFTFGCGNRRSEVPEYDLSGPYPGAMSQPNPRILQTLATSGGGKFYDLASTPSYIIEQSLLSDVRDIVASGRPVPNVQFYPLLIAAAILLLGYQIAPLTYGIRPRSAIAILAFATMFSSTAMKAPEDAATIFQQALKETKEGRYDDASKKLQSLQQKGASEEVEVAMGNVAFARKQYDESIRYYRSALEKNPGNERARWNWEVALKHKSQQSNPPPPPPSPQQQPQQLPKETSALLKYFDQQETEQIKKNNEQKANTSEFEW